MSVYQRNLIKQQKYFHRNYFRRWVVAALFSMTLSLLLLVAIFYVYINQPAIDYYASNTAGFIHPLKARDEANNSPDFLLKPDPPEEVSIKELNTK